MNLRANRISLGWKKTIGKILQPINMYTRFPEYQLFHAAIRPDVGGRTDSLRRVLDVGSPKLFGFFLASRYEIRIHLTDLNPNDIEEYSTMWSALCGGATGHAVLERQDARALTYNDESYEIVYSMSAIEHVENEGGDTLAVRELWRVLRPTGLLIISVPFGDRYQEQMATGFSYSTTAVQSSKSHFFQRVYDKEAVEARLLAALAPSPAEVRVHTAYRSRKMPIAKAYHRLRRRVGLDVSGFFGFLNPILSAVLNRSCEGYAQDFLVSYGPAHSISDVYADAVLVCRKPG
jgi:SAM-dependent methyltransferase